MEIYYGNKNILLKVTDLYADKLQKNIKFIIPANDTERALLFGDPIYGIVKKVYIINKFGNLVEFDDTCEITIENRDIYVKSSCIFYNKLHDIQGQLLIHHGTFDEEFPEQKMAVRYLTGNEKILEIGGNIGRMSLITSYILKDSSNIVTLETDLENCKKLEENREINNFHFNIEPSALSKRKLIQKGWDTIPSDILLDGYKWVNTITLDELKNKYNIQFDTLLIDCEGAFYFILIDMPEILDNINLIIMENDYRDKTHKEYVDSVLIKNNFYVDYSEMGGGGVCVTHFYEVWKKSNIIINNKII
jgi:FkbM family methyltransferase